MGRGGRRRSSVDALKGMKDNFTDCLQQRNLKAARDKEAEVRPLERDPETKMPEQRKSYNGQDPKLVAKMRLKTFRLSDMTTGAAKASDSIRAAMSPTRGAIRSLSISGRAGKDAEAIKKKKEEEEKKKKMEDNGLNLESRASMISKQVKKEKVVKELLAGEYFGEICLVLNTPRTCNVRAKSFCELTVLTRHDFDEVVGNFDDERKVLEEIIMEKYKGEAKDWSLQRKNMKTLKIEDVINQQKESESNIGKVLQNIDRRLRSMEESIEDNSEKTGRALTRMSRNTMSRGTRRTRNSRKSSPKSPKRSSRSSARKTNEDEDNEQLSSGDEVDERIAQSLSSIIAQSAAGGGVAEATSLNTLKAVIKQARGEIEMEDDEGSEGEESASGSSDNSNDDEEDEARERRQRKSRLSFDEYKEDPGRQLEMSKKMIATLVDKLNSIIREIRGKSFINDFLIARLKVLKNEVSFLYGNIDKIGDGMPPNSAMFTAHNVTERKEQMVSLERVQGKVMELLDEAASMNRYRSNLEDTAERTMIFQKQEMGERSSTTNFDA